MVKKIFRIFCLKIPALFICIAAAMESPALSSDIAGESSNLADTAIVLPVLKLIVKADYPSDLMARGIEGVVVLDLLIDSAGIVDSAAVVTGVIPALDSAAVNAAKQFVFFPATLDGRSVAVILRYAYTFSIDEQPVEFVEKINLRGTIFEKGTKTPLSNSVIALTFTDSITISGRVKKQTQLDSLHYGIPLKNYLRKIVKCTGQLFVDGQLIARTDSCGNYSFTSLPCGTIGITIVASGHKKFDGVVVIGSGKITEAIFYLRADSYNQNEIIVYGKSTDQEVLQHTIGGQEIRKVAGFNGEAIKVVQALPGVARAMFAQNELIIRGAQNYQSKVLYDGIELPYLYHDAAASDYLLGKSIINGDALKTVQLLPGGEGARYGNVVGGIVDLNSRPARTDRWHGTFDVNIKGYSLLLETPLTKELSVIGSLRGSLFDYTYDFISRNITNMPVEFLQYYYDYSLRFDYVARDGKSRIFVESIGASDTIADMRISWFTGRKPAPGEVNYSLGHKFIQAIAGWSGTLTPKVSNELRLGFRQEYSSMNNNRWQGYEPSDSETGRTFDVKDELTWKVSEKNRLAGGLDIHLSPMRGMRALTFMDTTFRIDFDMTIGNVGAYCFATWNPVERLTVTPGLRFDYYPMLQYSGALVPEFWDYTSFDNTTRFTGDPTVRCAIRYEIDKKQSMTVSAGTYSHSPDSMVLELLEYRDGLKSEKGSHVTIGYEWRPSDLVSLNLDAYFNQQWDLYREQTAADIMDERQWLIKCDGKARMSGVELMIRRDPGRCFSGWLAYSLGYSESYNFQEKSWVVDKYNVLNNIQAVMNWALPLENTVGLRMQYTEGYPYTPRVTQFYNATDFFYWAKSGGINPKRYPPYIGIDLNYSKKWVYKKSTLTTYIEFMRVLHLLQYFKEKNGNPIYKPSEINRYNYDYSALEGMAMFPMVSFGATWEF